MVTSVFQARVVSIKNDESVTLVHMVRINKQANLTVHSGMFGRLCSSLVSDILIYCININS